MHYSSLVKMTENLNYLCKVVYHNLLLLFGKFKMFVDRSHKSKDIAIRANLQYEPDIAFVLNDFPELNNSGMFDIVEDKFLNSSFM